MFTSNGEHAFFLSLLTISTSAGRTPISKKRAVYKASFSIFAATFQLKVKQRTAV